MHETELWVTSVFNQYLAGIANTILGLAGVNAENPAKPWANFVVMELIVAAIIIILFAMLRSRLSVENPGKLQHTLELVYNFVHHESEDQVGHDGPKYVSFFGTLFVFILLMNLIGVVPGLESPTMSPSVPLGCAAATFIYYNIMGMRANGVFGYLAHFAGPMPLLAPLMIPIEIVSNLARPLSLTIRLFANMFAGEQVTIQFLNLTYFLIPAAFMGLHVFVSFLQAYIFMLMTMMYVAGAVAHEH